MFDFALGYFVGLLAVAVVLAGCVVALDRRIDDLSLSTTYVLAGMTLPAFALAVLLGHVERVGEWALALLCFYLFFLVTLDRDRAGA